MSVKETNNKNFRLSSSDKHDGSEQPCVSSNLLFQFADNSLESAPSEVRDHVHGCLDCAGNFSVLGAAKALSQLPPRWTTHLGCPTRAWTRDDLTEPVQILGVMHLRQRTFSACHEDDWVASTSGMRVNLVFDQQHQFFAITILDVPIGVAGMSLLTSEGQQTLWFDEGDHLFELLYCDGELESPVECQLRYSELAILLLAHKLEVVVDMKSADDVHDDSQPNDVIELLTQHQAIERRADYLLPCGVHSDTYINSSALCVSEESMHFLAAKLDFLLWDKYFDTVLANGWAMALIARRLAAAREAQGRRAPTRQVLCEGYQEPILLDDIVPGSQVLIVLDVVISGRLALELQRIVKAAGADAVAVAAIARPHGAAPVPGLDLRSLCEIEMHLSAHPLLHICGRELTQQVFNPIAGCMTTKCLAPRSPSQFLQDNPSAKELWSYVQAAEAYEHHRREGDTHYIGFVDTRKLMECRGIGEELVDKLVDVVSKSGNQPTYLLVPNRSRAGLLAQLATKAFHAKCGFRPETVVATRKWTTGQWELPPDQFAQLPDADVLIVDTAAGHGRTIDQLATLASKSKARRIGAAVLLSRLTPPCEDTFNLRLSGGYHRLFNLPIRPVAIRGNRIDLCPVCRRKNAIRRFAEESDIQALEQWADSLLKKRRGAPEPVRRSCEKQLRLFELEQPFLSDCGAAVASGVTLHALGAASSNGSAPLSLPELFDDRISWRVRASIVENLPTGILDWTGTTLIADLVTVLADGEYPSVWKAAANLLAREGNNVWMNYLEAMLHRADDCKMRFSDSFWNHMACNVYLSACGGQEVRHELLDRLEQIVGRQEDGQVLCGLRQMQEVIRD